MRLGCFAVVLGVLALAACGGGGGGGSTPPVTSSTAPTPTSPPTVAPNQVIGSARDVATQSFGNTITYDQAEGVGMVDANGALTDVGAIAPFPTTGLPLPQISAVAFDAKTQATLVSSGSAIYAVTRGVVSQVASGFFSIYDMTVDPSGNIFVIDGDHVAEVVNGHAALITQPGSFPVANIVSILPVPGWAHLTFDSKDGNLYVANPAQNVIDRVSTAGAITAIAGSCVTGQSLTSTSDCAFAMIPGTGANAIFGCPTGIVYDPNADELYVADALNDVIWSVTTSGSASILAGYGSPGTAGTGGTANGRYALYDDPYALGLDSAHGLLYIRQYDTATDIVDTLALVGSPAPVRQFPVATYWLPSHHQLFGGMSGANDGSVWFISSTGSYIANVTATGASSEYQIPVYGMTVYDDRVTVDPSGYAWTATSDVSTPTDSFIQCTTGGCATSYNVPVAATSGPNSSINNTTVGPDGNVWYAQKTDNGGSIGSVSDAGAVTQYPLANQQLFAQSPQDIATGPDGNLWYLLTGAEQSPVIGRITPQGQYLSTYSIDPSAFRLKPDVSHGRIWYITASGIGYMTASGAATPFSLGCGDADCSPTDLAIGTDGTAWVVEAGYSDVAHVEASGTVVRYLMPFEAPGLMYIAARGDGTFWVDSNVGALFLFNPSLYDSDGLPYASASKKRSSARPSTPTFR